MGCKFYNTDLKRCTCKVLAKFEQGRVILYDPDKPCNKSCTWFHTGSMSYSEACSIATNAHLGQKRKFSGLPYIIHPRVVANKFINIDYKILAILHDVVEDTNITIKMLVSEYHLAEHIADALSIITKCKDQNYLEYIMQFKYNDMARAVKIEDIKHNMSDLENGCMYQKYEMALYILKKM